ncbi:hypothetical protein M513_02649 [Trichuris suis]|uniref:Uncharacterized protein n=1 Tax=Trichuris suis TaxID=68888 RepID=A0A085MH49_9BILA|nr:hypothetical protein M513_02649 [Trichuris suis]
MSERKNESEKKRKKQQDHVVILPPEVTPMDKTLKLDGKDKSLKPAIEYAKWPGRTKFIAKEGSQSPNDNQQKDFETPQRKEGEKK